MIYFRKWYDQTIIRAKLIKRKKEDGKSPFILITFIKIDSEKWGKMRWGRSSDDEL